MKKKTKCWHETADLTPKETMLIVSNSIHVGTTYSCYKLKHVVLCLQNTNYWTGKWTCLNSQQMFSISLIQLPIVVFASSF